MINRNLSQNEISSARRMWRRTLSTFLCGGVLFAITEESLMDERQSSSEHEDQQQLVSDQIIKGWRAGEMGRVTSVPSFPMTQIYSPLIFKPFNRSIQVYSRRIKIYEHWFLPADQALRRKRGITSPFQPQVVKSLPNIPQALCLLYSIQNQLIIIYSAP